MVECIVGPRQTRLFGIFDEILSETANGRLKNSCLLVRQVILELMPVGPWGGYFDAQFGRPSKELDSIAGLLLIKELMLLEVLSRK